MSKLSELSGHPESLGAVSTWGVPAFWLVWIGFLVLAAQDLIRRDEPQQLWQPCSESPNISCWGWGCFSVLRSSWANTRRCHLPATSSLSTVPSP